MILKLGWDTQDFPAVGRIVEEHLFCKWVVRGRKWDQTSSLHSHLDIFTASPTAHILALLRLLTIPRGSVYASLDSNCFCQCNSAQRKPTSKDSRLCLFYVFVMVSTDTNLFRLGWIEMSVTCSMTPKWIVGEVQRHAQCILHAAVLRDFT